MARDHYDILGVTKNASAEEIRKAYRRLARKFHPDLNPNDEEAKKRFQEINEANEVLSDPGSRKKYDTYGDRWKHAEEFEKARSAQGAHTSGGPHSGGPFGSYNADEDIFSSIFGGRRGHQVKFRGQDLKAELQLDLMEAWRTHKRTLTVNGRQIRITIPAGVEDEQTIRIPGQGGPGMNGGPDGDLYITFRIAPHPRYKRVGRDLHATAELDLYTAVLGGEHTVETLDGMVKLKVAPGTGNGTRVRLKGKGFPVYKQEGSFGDLIITYHVVLPTQLSARERELFEELARLRKDHVS
jgi:curved DNA-binding protein